MTCTGPSCRRRAMRRDHIRLLAACTLLALAAACSTFALTVDRSQPLAVTAQRFSVDQTKHIAHLHGEVVLEQGSLHGSGTDATVYMDAGNKITRIVLMGDPARLSQQMDAGGEMHGSALTIDYTPDANTATLMGDAHVEQAGRGSFSGAKLVYDTGTGAMQGEGGRGQVKLIFQPRAQAGAAPLGAPASQVQQVQPARPRSAEGND